VSEEQWINLPVDDDYVEDSIGSKERLGPARFKVKFKKASLAGFRVKIIPKGGDHEKYSAAERKRNSNFRVRVSASATNNAQKEVVLEKEVFLSAAGGNEYKIQAKYKKTEVESGLLLSSRRKLFYQVMSMTGISAGSTATLEQAFWNPGKKFFIEMRKRGGTPHVKYLPCLDGDNDDDFIRSSAKGYQLKKYKPYAFGVNFVNYIATPEELEIERAVNFTLPSKISQWNAGDQEWTVKLPSNLWYELDPADDAKRRWLKGCELWFEPDAAPGTKEIVPIAAGDIVPSGAKTGAHGGRKELKVRVPVNDANRNLFTERKGKWKIKLKLLFVRGFSAGFAYNAINLIAIATKAWWNDSTSGAEYVLNHEIGHKVGMVADGKGKSPDTHAHLYGDKRGVNDQDHQGPHCSNGAAWDASKKRGKRWSGTPKCVMFGATGIGGTRAPPEFCDECAPIVRKLDLSDTRLLQTGFRISMDEY
jgi:hypothetical protein